MHGIVAFAVIVGLVLLVMAFARSRPKAGVVRAATPEPEGFAEFAALVERKTGRHLDLPAAAPAAVARPAPRAPQPPPPPPKAKLEHSATPPKRRTQTAAPKPPPRQPLAPPARPPLAALGIAPPLRRHGALAALAPLEPNAPLAPRAVRSP